MKPYLRADRVGIKIQIALTDLLIKKIKDPRIKMATISSVKVTSDLRVAYVYFSIFGDKQKLEAVKHGFDSSHGFIKKSIASTLGLRYMPELKFIHDTSFEHGLKIDSLLKSISKNHD
ncbi:MAG: ribosome-binding factor A [Desulfobacteraceae bacterium 4572_130]|nr:MAG: ribosome-binding factor A [Desulfobacteraceae bacterium 4572_130]